MFWQASALAIEYDPVLFRLVDLVKDAAIGKVRFLRGSPAARYLLDGEQVHLGKLASVFLGCFFGGRTVIVLGDDVLRFIRVQIVQVSLSSLARAMLVGKLVDHGYRWFRQNADGWRDDVELGRAQFLDGQVSLVFPGDQHVADAAFHEGGGGAACTGVEHRHVFIQFAEEFLGLGFVAARLTQGVAPGCQVIPAGAARGFRIWRDDRYARLDQVIPVLDAFRVALAYQEHDGRGVRRAVVRKFLLPVGSQQLVVGQRIDVVG